MFSLFGKRRVTFSTLNVMTFHEWVVWGVYNLKFSTDRPVANASDVQHLSGHIFIFSHSWVFRRDWSGMCDAEAGGCMRSIRLFSYLCSRVWSYNLKACLIGFTFRLCYSFLHTLPSHWNNPCWAWIYSASAHTVWPGRRYTLLLAQTSCSSFRYSPHTQAAFVGLDFCSAPRMDVLCSWSTHQNSPTDRMPGVVFIVKRKKQQRPPNKIVKFTWNILIQIKCKNSTFTTILTADYFV